MAGVDHVAALQLIGSLAQHRLLIDASSGPRSFIPVASVVMTPDRQKSALMAEGTQTSSGELLIKGFKERDPIAKVVDLVVDSVSGTTVQLKAPFNADSLGMPRGSVVMKSNGSASTRLAQGILPNQPAVASILLETPLPRVAEVNVRREHNRVWCFGEFVAEVYFPYYGRKWKDSTKDNNVNRVSVHLVSTFGERELAAFKRDELQDFLDGKAKREGPSFSVVDHLRWYLKQIFDMAVAEGHIERNPALLLFTPKEAKKPVRRAMTISEVQLCFASLDSPGAVDSEACHPRRDASRRNLRVDLGAFDRDIRGHSPENSSRQARHSKDRQFVSQGCPVRGSAGGG